MPDPTPRNYAPRIRLICAKAPEHFDQILVGTPLPASAISGMQRCPFAECGGFIEVQQPPHSVEIHWTSPADAEG